METEFNLFGALVALALVLAGGVSLWRKARGQPLLPDPSFSRAPNGDLRTPAGRFALANAQFLPVQGEDVPFTRIEGVFVRGFSGRRLAVGLVLEGDEWLQVGVIPNNEMRQAAYHAELLAEAVKGAGVAFRAAAASQDWQRVMMGEAMVFRFPAERP
ncbi:MAG: hypothetical protein HC915_02710 [Anaerolineae bacterium]|nr:hypothetical protein [Anaerolineae bacterium]